MDEFQEAVGFAVFGAVLRDGPEDQFGVGVEYGEFHQVGGVEHHIGVLLIGIDPLLFGAADVRPLVDGLAGGEGAVVVVADDAAQQPVVAGRHPVVVVERDAGEGRDEDLERILRRDLRDQLRVEGVDAFDQQHLAFRQLQVLAVVLAAARHEIEFRHVHHFAAQEREHVALDGPVVHGLEVIEVVAAVGQLGRLDAVHEIVIGRERDRAESAGLELNAQAPRDRGLAAAGRPGDQHDAHRMHGVVVAPLDFLGDLHEFLLLQRFGDLDQVGRAAFLTDVVHVAGVAQVHDPVPLEIFREDLEGLRLVHVRGQHFGIVPVRNAQQDAAVIRDDVPDLDIGSRGQQAAVIIVHRIPQRIEIHIGLSARFQQTHLVVVTVFAEYLDRLFQPDFAAMERQVLVDDLLHARLDLADVLFRHRASVGLVPLAEITVRNGMLDLDLRLGADVLRGLAEQEAERAAVHAACAGIAQVQELDVAVVVDAETKALRDIVHLGGNNRVRAFEIELREHLLEGCSFIELLVSLVVLAIDPKHGLRYLLDVQGGIDEVEQVVPDALAAGLVVDFVAHSGIDLGGHVGIAHLRQQAHRLAELGVRAAAGIQLAGHEMDRHGRIPQRPALAAVAVLHQAEQVVESVGREYILAEGIFGIRAENFRIRANPRHRSFGDEGFAIGAERHFLQEIGTVVPALRAAEEAREGLPRPFGGIVDRASAHDEPRDAVIVAFEERADDHRAHAVAIENDRQTGILRADPVVHHPDVFHHRQPAAVIHIAQVFGRFDGLAVAAVVVDDADQPLVRQEFHQGDIAFFVFAHAVDKLDHAARSAGFGIGHGLEAGKFQPIGRSVQRESIDSHSRKQGLSLRIYEIARESTRFRMNYLYF